MSLIGLRGVGKTVLLKEYRALASESDWVVIRRDLSARMCQESDFARTIADDLEGDDPRVLRVAARASTPTPPRSSATSCGASTRAGKTIDNRSDRSR